VLIVPQILERATPPEPATNGTSLCYVSESLSPLIEAAD